MKKILSLLLCSIMVVMAAACSTSNKVYNPETGLIGDKLIIGVDDQFPPMGFRDEDQNLVGFDIELAKAVAKQMNIEVVFQPINWENKIFEIQKGTVDVLWNGLTITEKRKKSIDYTTPYLANAQVIIVKKDSSISKKSDLGGKVVAVQKDSSAVEAIQEDEIKDKIKTLVEYEDNVTALSDVKIGRVDALVVDLVVAEYYLAKEPDTYKILEEDLAPEEYGIGVLKGNSVLLNKIQKALDEVIANGEATKISEKWFGVDKVLSDKAVG